MFTTDADVLAPARPGESKAVLGALAERFLAELPESARQEYRCAACQRFLARYGALVTIDARGQATPLLWRPAEAEGLFVPVVKALHDRVAKAAVTGVFLDHRAAFAVAGHHV